MGAARILVVDDNTADVKLLRLALDQQGDDYILEVLKTGEDALRFVEGCRGGTLEPEPCVIVLDLHLPRYDGLAILREIRKAPETSHIHVMVLSGAASPRDKEQISALGAYYRQKPFNLSEYSELGAEILAICAEAVSFA